MHFRDSPDSLSGFGIPGNIWFRRFAVAYTEMKLMFAEISTFMLSENIICSEIAS